jgi:hypothetical protein
MIPPHPTKNLPILSAPCNLPKTCPPATNEEFHDPSPYDGMTDSNGSDSDSEDRTIPPHPTKNPTVKSVPHDPSKTCLMKHMVDDDPPIPIHGGGGITQYQPSTDNDDNGSDYLFPTKAVDSPPIITLLRGPLMNYPLWRIPLCRVDTTKVSNQHHLCIHLLISSHQGSLRPLPTKLRKGCQHIISVSRAYV